MRRTTLAVLSLAAALAAAALAGEPKKSQPCVGIWGAKSAVKERTIQRVTNAEDWTALWLRHAGADPATHSAYYNAAGVPDVDFTRCMVVAILQGERVNSAGVRIESIEEDDERVLVRFDDRSYQTAGPDGGAQRCTAYGFFVVPRSTKPLVVEEDVQSMIGKAPSWKERARFPAM